MFATPVASSSRTACSWRRTTTRNTKKLAGSIRRIVQHVEKDSRQDSVCTNTSCLYTKRKVISNVNFAPMTSSNYSLRILTSSGTSYRFIKTTHEWPTWSLGLSKNPILFLPERNRNRKWLLLRNNLAPKELPKPRQSWRIILISTTMNMIVTIPTVTNRIVWQNEYISMNLMLSTWKIKCSWFQNHRKPSTS